MRWTVSFLYSEFYSSDLTDHKLTDWSWNLVLNPLNLFRSSYFLLYHPIISADAKVQVLGIFIAHGPGSSLPTHILPSAIPPEPTMLVPGDPLVTTGRPYTWLSLMSSINSTSHCPVSVAI